MKSIALFIFAFLFIASTHATDKKAIDPFDYNFCGGERVYPIIGVNFSTACGPRNQLALGRRGKLMWFFPGDEKRHKAYRGSYKLSPQQLISLSTMAEVAKITETTEPTPHRVLYKMGINFSARQPKYIFAAHTQEYTPSNELLKLMLSMVPKSERPYLPDCGKTTSLFDPTENLQQRKQRTQLVKTYDK